MTAIEWTDRSWNPIVGCSVVSPGCTNCYAMRQAARIEKMTLSSAYDGTTQWSKAGAVWTGKVAFAGDHKLTEPLRRRKPTTWFVNSMGDLFHESVPDEWIDRVFAVMALCPQHTFQVLTKRAKRMREYMTGAGYIDGRASPIICELMGPFCEDDSPNADAIWELMERARDKIEKPLVERWPLPNVWLGASAEDQARADERIPDLLATPAAVRFVSAEPLLGPIDLTWLPWPSDDDDQEGDGVMDALRGRAWIRGADNWPNHPVMPNWRYKDGSSGPRQYLDDPANRFARLDWVIVGGESGANARPMHPDWARAIRDQCAAAGVPFFFKQWGEYLASECLPDDLAESDQPLCIHGADFHRVGKSRAGRMLDGVTHDAMPGARK